MQISTYSWIPPALWATGGLEPSWNPHPNIHSTPFPPTSLGGGVYPSSFLLPGLQNWPADLGHGRPYAIIAPFWPSSFFHYFFNTLLCWFWLDVGPNLEPKSLKNRSQDGFFRIPKLHQTIFRMLLYLPCVLLGFEGRRLPNITPKSIQFRRKTDPKVTWF